MMEESVINGICCDVENCVYNNGSCRAAFAGLAVLT